MAGSGHLIRLQRAWLAAGRVARTRYPRFVFGLRPAPGQIPVFNYHDVDTETFTRDLEFLRRNGYRTTTLEEFERGRRARSRERRVLLTFDDGRRSFRDTVFPILRDYRAHAALFVPTWWMNGSSPASGGRELFMSWNELRECAASGWVDVQSHAHRHAIVHTKAELADFAHPAALQHFDLYDWPMRHGNSGDELGAPAPGTPVYRATPLLSAETRYLESTGLAEDCRDFVAKAGGASFFTRPGWRKALRAFHASAASKLRGRFMQPRAFRQLVASEFECSRDLFRTELGYAPTYFAFPWRLGSLESLALARHMGIRVAFGVALDYGAERMQLPVRVYGRFKCDWLRFLPGKGRASALDTIGRKLLRLSSIRHLAH